MPQPRALLCCVAASLVLSLFQGCGGEDAPPPAGAGASAGQGEAGAAGLAGQGGAGAGGAGMGGAGEGQGGAGSGGTGGTGGASAGGDLQQLREKLDAGGFDVLDGSFEFLDLSGCCATSCLGNNPSSPYATFRVPPGKGQVEPNPFADEKGVSPAYRLRADEAVVYVGKTPPRGKYFGFTPYVSQRTENGKVIQPFASVNETLNDRMMFKEGGGDPFDRPVVIVAALDQGVDAQVRASLVAAGYPSSWIHSLVFDPSKSRPGLEAEADAFSVLFRMAIPEEPAAFEAYRKAPPGTVLRVTPRVAAAPQPFPPQQPRPKDTTNTEAALEPSVELLEKAIQEAFPGYTSKVMLTTQGTPDPDACLAGEAACAYDNRDTIYPATVPQKLLDDPEDFLMVYGVNHAASGKASYGSVSVYAVKSLVGVLSVTSAEYEGSASTFLPEHPDAPRLYAWKLARSCGGEAGCTEIPYGTCPDGIADEDLVSLAFRVYQEPGTATAPAPSTLVIDRVMRFSKK